MPRFLEAGGTFDYVLESDRHLEKPPTFLLAALSKRQAKELRKTTRAYFDEKDVDQRDALLTQALGIVVKGWKNFPTEFSQDQLENLTEMECLDLVSAATLGSYLTPEDKKKSELQCKSETA